MSNTEVKETNHFQGRAQLTSTEDVYRISIWVKTGNNIYLEDIKCPFGKLEAESLLNSLLQVAESAYVLGLSHGYKDHVNKVKKLLEV